MSLLALAPAPDVAGSRVRGYHELPISGEHALATEALPPLHRDPFDRLLPGQAVVEGVTLLTGDAVVAGYPVAVRAV